MANTQPLRLRVVASENIGGLFQRITLSGDGLNAERIPPAWQGLHIKLFFRQPHQAALVLPYRKQGKIVWPAAENKPLARTFSIYAFDEAKQQLQVDFVRHNEYGIACDFATRAKPGDELGFAGPGPMQLVRGDTPSVLLIGDLAGVPAIASVAAALEVSCRAQLLIEVENEQQMAVVQQQYFANSRHNLRFIVQNYSDKTELLVQVQTLGIQHSPQQWGVAIAAEHQSVLAVRRYLRRLDFNKQQLYAVPYWHYQKNEESYHAQRHDVMDS